MWLAMRNDFIVNEIFTSIDGEGKRAGQLATFIRLAGCNMRCCYCDTLYAVNRNQGDPMSIEEILEMCPIKRITLTGGEPLYHPNVAELLKVLVSKGFEVNIETNGSIDIKEAKDIFRGSSSFITMDIKCPESGMELCNNFNNLQYLDERDVIKFVVGSLGDLDYMKQIIRTKLQNVRAQIYISPVFEQIHPVQIVDFIRDNNLTEVKLQLQVHKIIWDPKKRGV